MFLPFKAHSENFGIKAPALALRAFDRGVFHEIHVHPHRAHAVAIGAGAFCHIEAEMAGVKAAQFAFGQFGKEIADIVEQFDIGRRIRARRAADGRLVDGDHFVEMIEPSNGSMFSDGQMGVMELIGQSRGERDRR